MVENRSLLFHYFSCSIIFCMTLLCGGTNLDTERKLYIVYMGSLREGHFSVSSQHETMLQEVVQSSSLENILVRSYTRSFNGFAAKLNDKERQNLSSMKGVVSIFPSRTFHLHTTRSWDFMGFNESVNRKPNIESDIIIGSIDSGIWPESNSFRDEGFGPPPKKWKGACKGGENFTCNNKLIGARYYTSSVAAKTARDTVGHGTHTASTAVGNLIKDASLAGLAQGTARGGVPSARIAAYKVCYQLEDGTVGCAGADILAAFDDAIADGVDIITVSLGGQAATSLQADPIAIGAFHAMAKGILTVNSAGNNGNSPYTLSSVAPWLFSIAASTTDRLFVDNIILGNGKTIKGFSINPFSLGGKKHPLAHGKEVSSSSCSIDFAELCTNSCLDPDKVKGKIVICNKTTQGYNPAFDAGATGSIIKNDEPQRVSSVVKFPTSIVNATEYDALLSYWKSAKNPQAEILKSEVIKDSTAPVVAWFSSRGPNSAIPEILKPDISAPGVHILAAYPPVQSSNKQSTEYNIFSGTSMSCPHVAGVAAYVKTFHPDWSPSAIKSAIMTTAWTMDPTTDRDGGFVSSEFAYGSGHINPVKAVDPGLVYETLKPDYIKMLCSNGANDEVVRSISGDNSTCPKGSDKESPKDLNYPSMTGVIRQKEPFKITFNRTVTNVGLPNSIYKAKVSQAQNVSIKVEPAVLSFKTLNEKQSFIVTVSGSSGQDILSSSLVWSDGKHNVRSPIVMYV